MPDAVMLGVGLLAVTVGLLAAVLVVALPVVRARSGVGRSLAAVQQMRTSPRSVRERALQVPFTERALGPAMVAVTRLGRRLTPRDQLRRTERRLDLAGNPPSWDLDRVLSLKVLLTFAGTAVTVLVCLLLAVGGWRSLAAVGVVGLLGWVTPSLIIYQKGYDRSEAMLRELPDALDLLTISVESGLGFDAAVRQVARNTEGPLAMEFSRVLQEMRIGTGRMDALRDMGARTDLDDLKTFASAMVQADSYGVPIAAVLRVQADEMRSRRSQRAEEAAQKVPVKILFPLIFGVLPALLVVVVGPALVAAFTSFRAL